MTMNTVVNYAVNETYVVITINNGKVNAISHQVVDELI